MANNIIGFESLGMNDVEQVGGKNASLGEMISHLSEAGVTVPGGFATTAVAYRTFIAESGLKEKIDKALTQLDVDDVKALMKTGAEIRQWICDAPLTAELEADIRQGYQQLCGDQSNIAVAVRSSATAEDLPDASFAGQQETYLNISGADDVVAHVKLVFASLFNDRAIAYRVHQGFAHSQVALSAGIQRMVRSDLGASGVLFTLDTETGFDKTVFVTSSYGLGETVVQGAVNPDEFYLYKPNLESGKPAILRRKRGTKAIKMIYAPEGSEEKVKTVEVAEEQRDLFSISDEDLQDLGRMAITIEKHYGRPMDVEWGKDGEDGKIYILQARPETVKSQQNEQIIRRYQLQQRGDVLASGRAIGQKIGAGEVCLVNSPDEMDLVKEGDILVTDMTDPDWEPVMKRASAIVTNRGGRTCHAAIIARELGIPAVVGCGNVTSKLASGQEVTVSCAEGDTGFVYQGNLAFEINEIHLGKMPPSPVKLMMNVGNPDRAFDFSNLPNEGIGLARLEFIINRMIGVHPRALLDFAQLEPGLKEQVTQYWSGYQGPREFFVEKLTEGIASLAASAYPKPTIVRLSDFKSNEYANLVGGREYEPREENPMLGFRGASRYVSEEFRSCFDMECEALLKVRNEMGLDNIWVMVPFVRTLEEASHVISLLKENGLERGKDDLKIVMMCELPANAILAEEFLQYFDGFSIGSNDLTQLTLGLDRDSGLVADKFDERNPAVTKFLSMAISACRSQNKYVGICGQGPSDHPDLARWLMKQGISSISLNPDSVVDTWMYLAGQGE